MRPSLRIPTLAVACLALAGAARAGRPADEGQGHRGWWIEGAGTSALVYEGGRARRSDLAEFCLSCHDGSVGPAVGYDCPHRAGELGAIDLSSLTLVVTHLHPTGMRLPRAPGFHSRAEVQGRLPLSDGVVSCVTCHSGTHVERHYLPTVGSPFELCPACHRR